MTRITRYEFGWRGNNSPYRLFQKNPELFKPLIDKATDARAVANRLIGEDAESDEHFAVDTHLTKRAVRVTLTAVSQKARLAARTDRVIDRAIASVASKGAA